MHSFLTLNKCTVIFDVIISYKSKKVTRSDSNFVEIMIGTKLYNQSLHNCIFAQFFNENGQNVIKIDNNHLSCFFWVTGTNDK